MAYRPAQAPYSGNGSQTPYEREQKLYNDIHRIADALERIADAVAGPVVVPPDPYGHFEIIANETGKLASTPAAPFIEIYQGRLMRAICIYCPAGRDSAADPQDPDTCLGYDDSYDLDEQRAALTRHLAHHTKLPDATSPLATWTWEDQTCPRCAAEPGEVCRTERGRPSTAVHSPRWRDHTEDFW